MPVNGNFRSFPQEMTKIFDWSVSGHAATHRLQNLHQANRSVANFAIEFRTLASSCDWNPAGLYDRFYHSLSDPIEDELIAVELPDDLDHLIDLTIRVDIRMQERRMSWRRYFPPQHHRPSPAPYRPSTPPRPPDHSTP